MQAAVDCHRADAVEGGGQPERKRRFRPRPTPTSRPCSTGRKRSDVHVSTDYSSSGSQVACATAPRNVKTNFMGLMGFTYLQVGAQSQAKWGNTRLRVALVLDNTGSMSSAGKMTALKTATKNLLDQLKGAATANGDVYVSIVPVRQGRQCSERATTTRPGSTGPIGKRHRPTWRPGLRTAATRTPGNRPGRAVPVPGAIRSHGFPLHHGAVNTARRTPPPSRRAAATRATFAPASTTATRSPAKPPSTITDVTTASRRHERFRAAGARAAEAPATVPAAEAAAARSAHRAITSTLGASRTRRLRPRTAPGTAARSIAAIPVHQIPATTTPTSRRRTQPSRRRCSPPNNTAPVRRRSCRSATIGPQ